MIIALMTFYYLKPNEETQDYSASPGWHNFVSTDLLTLTRATSSENSFLKATTFELSCFHATWWQTWLQNRCWQPATGFPFHNKLCRNHYPLSQADCSLLLLVTQWWTDPRSDVVETSESPTFRCGNLKPHPGFVKGTFLRRAIVLPSCCQMATQWYCLPRLP